MKSGENGLIGPGSNDYGRGENPNFTVKIPSCGRMVHYFPVLPDSIKAINPDYCKVFPALVIEASDLAVNMVVFSIGSTPCESKWGVPHKSLVLNENSEPTMSYWDWPQIK